MFLSSCLFWEIFCAYHLFLSCLWIYFLIVDSDHSSASVFDVADTDQDRLDLDLDVLPATLAASGKFRHCQCGRRMSSLSYDHHSFCSFCRGCERMHDNHCKECLLISKVQFTAYFKHQKSFKRKLVSKQRSKAVRLCPPRTIPWSRLG